VSAGANPVQASKLPGECLTFVREYPSSVIATRQIATRLGPSCTMRSFQSLTSRAGAGQQVVGVTLGPKGRNVVLETKYGSPKIVNDGVTVAKEVELEDPVENIGAKLVRQVSTHG